MSAPCFLVGLGSYLPQKIVTNADMERIVDTSDEWIRTRSGIRQRHFANGEESCAFLGTQAARRALENANLPPDAVTHILVGTFTGDYSLPTTACLIQDMLGLHDVPAFDISAACSGFLYALETARAFTALHSDAVILVIGSEVVTSRINFTDRSTCVLFGDGAGAAVVTASPLKPAIRVQDVMLHAEGSLGSLLTVQAPGSLQKPQLGDTIGPEYFVQMNGRDVFKHAVRFMVEISGAILQRNNLTSADIDLFIPHQANRRIIDAVGKKLHISAERVFTNLECVGNTSAASIPIALAEAREQGHCAPGMTVLLTSFGGGFTSAAALLQIAD